ncbi:Vacuolar protein sorting-associated protein 53 [Myotisia sp. PD_48]|nr:Vacuolar protein sorting-associated protein 53 [Myotisia sp. PD_48]
MLHPPTSRMNTTGSSSRNARGRAGTPDRGGIRKRGTPRVDRDGDLDMGAATGAAGVRGRKSRGQHDGGRRSAHNTVSRLGRRAHSDRDRSIDALQKAILGNTSSPVNLRRSRGGEDAGRSGLVQLRVQGWKSSKAASNPDGGIQSLIAFLEKKAPPPDYSATQSRLKITKSRVEGDSVIISVRSDQVDYFRRLNGFIFAGATISIELIEKPGNIAPGPSQAAIDTKARMTTFLEKRYSAPSKLLDLGKLGTDPYLVEMGMFSSVSTESKFFPALMKVCDLTFDSPEKKKVAVESVSLAHNQLANVATVTSLAQTFPDIKNLDLSNNQFKDTQSLSSWRWKFRDLVFLDLSGNPVVTDPTLKETMLKWYPKLQTLNNTPVRTPEEILAQNKKTPIPVLGASFQDESHIAENFIKAFFVGFDNDRNDLLNGIYDANSIFSFNVNTAAPRALQTESSPTWEAYIKKSRNLLKMSHLSARMTRSFVGTENIREMWNSFPRTKHPDILGNPTDWLVECHPIPGLPDPSGQSVNGVGGLLITVHGSFQELDPATGTKAQVRSFDRTFVLGPGQGIGGLRVSNDMLCLRTFGGSQAWIPDANQSIVPTPTATPIPQAVPSATQPIPQPLPTLPNATPGYGIPAPGKTDEQVKREQLVMEISLKTKMNLAFSEMALSGNNWDLNAALKNFEELKVSIPFLSHDVFTLYYYIGTELIFGVISDARKPSPQCILARRLINHADYNPIHHLNAIFSHPSSLIAVPKTSQALQDYQDELDQDITALTEAQAASNRESVERIRTTREDMAELFQKIEGVRERALKTEQTITEMTADIKQLDNAKRNLTLSMTTLKRLQMLTTAYEQLKALSKTRQYRDCAQLLQAVIQLMAHFKSYRSIDQIAMLSRNVSDIQRELLDQVCEDFELIFARGETMQKRNILSEGCLVMDALGDTARSRLITWYCNTQLREYRQVFRGNEEAGSLDNISRRYSWFKRMLKTYDEDHVSIFPASWKVDEILANVFCEGTRDDFKGILSRSVRSGQTLDVNLILSCLQESLDFEHFLDRRFTSASRASTDTFTSSEAPVFSQTISEAFEPYLSVWVSAQAKQLESLIRKYRDQPIKLPDDEFSPQLVIHSSTDLFTFYRHSLAQCAKLSTGTCLAELTKVFAKYLDQYAQQVLLYFISDRPGSQVSSKQQSLEDLVMVLNTADYCYSTCNQLEEKIKGRIDEQFKQGVDLQSQADGFMGIASAVVRLLVRKVDVDLDQAWKEMRNTSWNTLDSVGDQSSYVTVLLSNAKSTSETILGMLHKQQYARAFADNLVKYISTSYITNIYQCRPVSEAGAEQMLLDSYGLKTGLSGLLSPAPATFTKGLNQSFQKIDTLLKTLQVQASPAEALVQAYLIHIADRNDGNFRKILEIKGIRNKQEQNRLVELFQVHKTSERHASSLQQSNPVISHLQPSVAPSTSAATSSTVAQGLGLSNLGVVSNTPQGASTLPGRFDASTLGSALISAALDGVDRLGTPGLGALGGSNVAGGSGVGARVVSGSGHQSGAGTPLSTNTGGEAAEGGTSAAANLNENLKNIGKFFRRDLSGLGGRFGRGEDANQR